MNFSDMTARARRQIALYHLRTNPHNIPWGYHNLEKDGARCALGLMAEPFGIYVGEIPRREDGTADWENYKDPYILLGESLGVGQDALSRIYRENDKPAYRDGGNENFSRVADFAETLFANLDEGE